MDEARAREVLDGAGLTGDARLLALGENAVFALGDLVVKVGRPAPGLVERAAREVGIARWLEAAGVPAVRAAESEPRVVDGHPVTVWHRLGEAVRPAEAADLAGLIRQVHELDPPAADSFVLPPRELLGGVERWLTLAGDAIEPADADYLRERRDAFADVVRTLTPHLPKGPVHGDALPRNVLVTADGPVLVDLETFSSDFREHDLVVMALSKDRYGLDPAAYDSFVRVYGWDVREWDGCAVLRGARETASCAWVAQHAPTNPKALAEFERRVASLRDGDASVRWYPF
ncbi:phosphotransferase enzyme family protein [Streptomyces indicus]|uniref:Ser/Thr protein kinase RdoA involved in Cpx stress response, MazF antagonist n=1 Tax=Streptomyces indicus TaxID=417292 RepID=A0A1G8V7K0_9ACTN|nr:aminoglycoside phosphotransferase family protein [Streptomyces indicus]SDJ62051.1 Ser/Thr protein kinase RdoA involved in Cpx stress response, MazF antagonist [Streptomyces indicus]